MSRRYLRFRGVRGAYPVCDPEQLSIGGNTSCVEIRLDDLLIICDAGTGIIELGHRLQAIKQDAEALLLFSHYHLDHINGLPFFRPLYQKNWKIDLFGPGASEEQGIRPIINSYVCDPFFPLNEYHWHAEVNYLQEQKTIQYGPAVIERYMANHHGLTYAYVINVYGKKIIYCPDNECSFSVDMNPQHVNTQKDMYYKYIHQQEIISNADIFIHDAQYTPQDYEKKKRWGHSCYEAVVKLAMDAGVKSLYLFHHDPEYSGYKSNMIHQHCLEIIEKQKSNLQCCLACEGDIISL